MIVYTPPGYEASRARLPVLYLQDGQNLFDPATAFAGQDWRADAAADQLISAGAIEPLIVVGIYHTGVRRISEYTPTRDPRLRKGGKGDRYAQMLVRELRPWIDGEYRTRRGANDTAIGGSSLGGLVALQAGLLYPRVFGKLAVLSPSLWWDNRSILRLVRARIAAPRQRMWLDSGTAEGNQPSRVIEDLRALRAALTAAGWRTADLHYAEIEGGAHNEGAWGDRFGDVIEYLFPARA